MTERRYVCKRENIVRITWNVIAHRAANDFNTFASYYLIENKCTYTYLRFSWVYSLVEQVRRDFQFIAETIIDRGPFVYRQREIC